MLEQVIELDNQSPRHDIAEALLSGYDEPDAADVSPEPVEDPALAEQAHALRDHLEQSFPHDPSPPPEGWSILANLPPEESASLVSTLWTRLAGFSGLHAAPPEGGGGGGADPWTLLMGGNALVEMASTMGPRFTPEIEPLFRSFDLAQNHGHLADQIGWTASRAGAHSVVSALHDELSSGDKWKRLAATHMIQATGIHLGEAWPPIYGGAPTPATPRPISTFVDEVTTLDKGQYQEKMLDKSGLWGGAGSIIAVRDITTEWKRELDELRETDPAAAAMRDLENQRRNQELVNSWINTNANIGATIIDNMVVDPPRTAWGHLLCPQVVKAGVPFDLEVGIAEALSPGSGGMELVRPESSQGPYVLTIQLLTEGFTLGEG